MKWEKDGRRIGSSRRIRVYEDRGVYCLEIRECDTDDSGVYTCTARNFHGSTSSSTKLHVGCSLSEDEEIFADAAVEETMHAETDDTLDEHSAPADKFIKDDVNHKSDENSRKDRTYKDDENNKNYANDTFDKNDLKDKNDKSNANDSKDSKTKMTKDDKFEEDSTHTVTSIVSDKVVHEEEHVSSSHTTIISESNEVVNMRSVMVEWETQDEEEETGIDDKVHHSTSFSVSESCKAIIDVEYGETEGSGDTVTLSVTFEGGCVSIYLSRKKEHVQFLNITC